MGHLELQLDFLAPVRPASRSGGDAPARCVAESAYAIRWRHSLACPLATSRPLPIGACRCAGAPRVDEPESASLAQLPPPPTRHSLMSSMVQSERARAPSAPTGGGGRIAGDRSSQGGRHPRLATASAVAVTRGE